MTALSSLQERSNGHLVDCQGVDIVDPLMLYPELDELMQINTKHTKHEYVGRRVGLIDGVCVGVMVGTNDGLWLGVTVGI